ncbi:PREDICTED: peroxidase-like isoform X1 [Papilio polytes]|uniref:peroxidase-like isoform X1 n=2 Tax=Papilio polytes TaxID=76194 RepID=UPI00067612FD|nr:PREDICTED: peroxidase-like isoform X1 [Papilio polytes]
MLHFVCLLIISGYVNGLSLYYDSYTGTPVSVDEVKKHDKKNTTFWCINEIEPCVAEEWRRVDGSCNNLREPARGATHTPTYRILPPVYAKNFDKREAKSGRSLPLERFLRTTLVPMGKLTDQTFTTLSTNFLVFMTSDVLSLHDTVKYIAWKPYCCLPKGKTDRACVPNMIPDDDPVHRFSDIRCLNMTRPESFQSIGCTKNDTVPERILTGTPSFDLSTVYGNSRKPLLEKGRLYQKGLLKYEVDNGRVWPPTIKTGLDVCLSNQLPEEKRCHDIPEKGANSLAGINLVTIWLWRQHNLIATALSKINPCWDDHKLFYTARDINIAIVMQIFYYELLPALFGYENMLRDGVISSTSGFRDFYDNKLVPQISLEFPFVLRWFHTTQEGDMKLFDTEGHYLRKVPIVNFTIRTGFFGVEDNMDFVTQGNFRQGSAKFDYVVDPDIVNIGLGNHQRSADLLTSDLAKNRLFGLQPYIKYREYCFKQSFKTFDDLKQTIDPERVELLRDVYENIEDIDLLAGIWLERPLSGGRVPPTLYCILVEQLLRVMRSDRHWYERPNRPNAFTYEQLLEIRKASAARLLCDVGDKVTEIQKRAFYRISRNNPMCSCKEIDFVNLWAWKDQTCGTTEPVFDRLYDPAYLFQTEFLK